MKVFTIIRANEWWEYKFPPILAIGYMVIAGSGHNFLNLAEALLILILSLITGAAYVSMLNDATDISDDAIARKKNRLSQFRNLKRLWLISVPLLTGIGFTYYYASHKLSMVLYVTSYLCFTLYSLPPFRLKKRGISGILADAGGSQLFPTLLVAAFLYYKTRQPVNYYQLTGIGIWSFCFGLRGILWHQFHDLENDILSGIKTSVRGISNNQLFVTGAILICIELLAFATLLFTFKLLLPAIVILFYFLYVLGLSRKWKVRSIIIKPSQGPYRIFMNEYYQVFLPLSVLSSVVMEQPSVLIMILLHIVLFPVNMVRIFRESWLLLLTKRGLAYDAI